MAILLAALALWYGYTNRVRPQALARVSFSALPGWAAADLAPALAAFQQSCAALAKKPPSTSMGYAGAFGDWQVACVSAGGDPREFFTGNFTPYELEGGPGLFTGYYEPLISGSREKHGAYQTPVYGMPDDLVRADLGAFSPALKGEHISGRLQGHALVPYAARDEITRTGIANAKILFWCDDPVALFFLQIQGSGRVRLDDGTMERIAYAGENGRPYTAIGRVLIAQGQIKREDVSLSSIRAWLKAHPEKQNEILGTNQSYIFFREAPLGDARLGSPGTLGVGLTPGASAAVDMRLNALGAPYYVAADPLRGLFIAQDTGGAIRGLARADIFFGFGEKAEAQAGGMKARGRMFVLLPNALAERLGAYHRVP